MTLVKIGNITMPLKVFINQNLKALENVKKIKKFKHKQLRFMEHWIRNGWCDINAALSMAQTIK